jgi:hypothetical protein
MKEINVENIGPVRQLTIPVPEDGGVVVVRGRNGLGKTTAIEAVDSLMTGRGRPSTRDGALRGAVEGLGVTMSVARTTRRKGELEVLSLDGRLSVAELVDPGMVDAGAADAKRIKALVAIAQEPAEAGLFHALLPGGREEFERYVGAGATDGDDLVVMAARVKRDLEGAARKEEEQAEHARLHAQAMRDGLEALPEDMTERTHDAATLQADLEVAVRAEMQATAALAMKSRLKQEADEARTMLGAGGDTPSMTLSDARAAAAAAADAAVEAGKRASEARREAERLGHEEHVATARAKEAAAQVQAIEARGQLADKLNRQIEAGAGIELTAYEERVRDAKDTVAKARSAIERGAVVRHAIEQARKADEHEAKAREHEAGAAKLRDAAKGCDEVLSSVVGRFGTPLRVEGGRLVTTTERGATYYADLSHGERWKMALDIATEAVGRGGLLTIPQECFEGLDPINRQLIAEHAQQAGVVILTAEATDGELRAELQGAA